MPRKRRSFTASFKAKVALEALKNQKTISEIAQKHKLHPTQINLWKKQLLEGADEIFEDGRAKKSAPPEDQPRTEDLYEQIGRLKVQLEWIKKKWPKTLRDARRRIDYDNESLSIREQCRLLGIHRSSLYYQPHPETPENLGLMKLIDQEHLRRPSRGSRQMVDFLEGKGYRVNRKRIQRSMRKMGIESVAPKKRTTLSSSSNPKYPYLLRGLEIVRPNQVWYSDITYIPMKNGFMYLVAVMDWYSRNVLSWRVSNSMDVDFCMDALRDSLSEKTPEIFNTDQGSQFTSKEFTSELKSNGVAISMDGKGRAIDNVKIERLWRTLKYEEIYLKEYRDGAALTKGLKAYFKYYCQERQHQSLDGKTPAEVYNTAA